MRNVLAVSVILILLPVSASRGDVGQAQQFLLDATNSAVQAGSAGVVKNLNFAVIGQNQQAGDPYHRVTTIQSQDGVFVQGALAGSDGGGVFGVGQAGNVVGGQSQAVPAGGVNLGAQNQLLNGNFAQNAVHGSGIGAALGIQAGIFAQAQIIIGPGGASSNAQWLAVGNVDSVAAGP